MIHGKNKRKKKRNNKNVGAGAVALAALTPARMPGPFQTLLEHKPPLTPQQLRARRVELIRKIQVLRGRPLIIYATTTAISGQARVPAYVHREDIVPISEIVNSVDPGATAVDFLLETPGGLAEVTIEIVQLLRPRFNLVGFVIPHAAMSAGTILIMSGDEILMDHKSSLGAIDPQFVGTDGRLQPAQAILQGIETIKQDVATSGGLNPVYIPIIRGSCSQPRTRESSPQTSLRTGSRPTSSATGLNTVRRESR